MQRGNVYSSTHTALHNYLLMGSTAMALGLVFAPTRSISALSMLSRLSTSIRAQTLSTQYRLFVIQSTAMSSTKGNLQSCAGGIMIFVLDLPTAWILEFTSICSSSPFRFAW